MSRIKQKKPNLPNAFDSESHKTEWTCAAKLAEWINEIAQDKKIPIGKAEVETKLKESGKRSDISIYETPKNVKVLCVIECKQPFWDVFKEELTVDARSKGNQRKSPYFATTNFKKLIWWNTERANNTVLNEEEQILDKYNLSEIENLDEIENVRYREPIRKELEKFISKLYLVHTRKEPEPKQAIDEHLIDRIHEKIRVLSLFYTDIIRDKFHKEPQFAKSLKDWFDEQMWEFSGQKSDFDKAARQAAYLLINKILFYNALQSKRPKELDPLDIPKSLTIGGMLQSQLQSYFNRVLKEIDYETIYTTDFIDEIAFPDDDDLVSQIKELTYTLNRYDFAKLGFDILGRIFERLIPPNERHILGQYFTSPDVVDLILQFCSQNEDDRLLDPSCGAGTFLVRAYQQKKLMNQYKNHEEILDKLWGNDIAKFPAHLSTINLAINDLAVLKNYPNILRSDFFALQVGPEGFDNDNWRKRRAKTLGIDEREILYPRYFDAIVGNPPYTRQEEIGDTGVDKSKTIASALIFGNKKIANISKRAGIHAYFFVHGTKFLKEGGYFGFIVSNSWMDSEYGGGLKEFFLRNYKIIAIIESKVERWFADADVNTCIVILQKCSDEKERMQNLVRFTLLKKNLRNFIPAAENLWSKQVDRKDEIDKLIQTILAHSRYYENDDLRVFPISQRELWEEGLIEVEEDYDEKKKNIISLKKNDAQGRIEDAEVEYVRKNLYIEITKWGKYIRAPKIFFTIIEKGKDKLIPLKEVADVRFGIKSGANEFFYLTEEKIKKLRIEKEFWMHIDENGKWFPNYVIKSPRECKSIIVKPEDLKFRLLIIHKDKKELKGTNALQYILHGERKDFQKRPTCANRLRWYDLGKQLPADGLWFKAFNDRVIAPINKVGFYSSDRFYAVYLHNQHFKNRLFQYLNSTIASLFIEIFGRVSLGEGALDNMTYEAAAMLILDVRRYNIKDGKVFKDFMIRPIVSIFDEVGAKKPTDVSLSKIKPDRRELDKIIMGDILGLSEEEQLEVYRAVVDLVKSRIDKAGSTKKNDKFVEGIDIKMAKKDALQEIDKRKK